MAGGEAWKLGCEGEEEEGKGLDLKGLPVESLLCGDEMREFVAKTRILEIATEAFVASSLQYSLIRDGDGFSCLSGSLAVGDENSEPAKQVGRELSFKVDDFSMTASASAACGDGERTRHMFVWLPSGCDHTAPSRCVCSDVSVCDVMSCICGCDVSA